MQKFVIWFQHRSGSTHLVSLLNSHPEIRCKGEIFGCYPLDGGAEADQRETTGRLLGKNIYRRVINRFPGRIHDPDDRQCTEQLDDFFNLDAGTTSVNKHPLRGFKFKYPSQSTLFPEVERWLCERNAQFKIIMLTRRDFLRRALSVLNLRRIQEATKKANVRHPLDMTPAEFNVPEIIRLIFYYQEIDGLFRSWPLKFDRYLEVDYNELNRDEENICAAIQKFLGVQKARKLVSKVHKSSPDDIQKIVANYDELKTSLQRAGLDDLL